MCYFHPQAFYFAGQLVFASAKLAVLTGVYLSLNLAVCIAYNENEKYRTPGGNFFKTT